MMTAEEVLNFAHQRGIHLDAEDAELFIKTLAERAAHPGSILAKHFEYLFTPTDSFEAFLTASECPPGCPYCYEASMRYGRRRVAALADIPDWDIVGKAQKFFRVTNAEPLRLEGWRAFSARTGLTADKVKNMGTFELEAYR